MPCFKPLKGYRSKDRNPSGKRSIVFSKGEAYADMPLEISCGQCIGCRLERSRQWAVRIMHEASLYPDNCFITLTYSEDKLPPGGSLRVEDFQKFMKRLREDVSSNKKSPLYSPDRRIRFFHCGEYGEQTMRPHYHACLFNFDFADKVHYQTRNDHQVYRSPKLEELWQDGISEIGTLTFESAAYVARYICKKVTGKRAEDHYMILDHTTGEIVDRRPEYVTMSRRPGIGKAWLEKFQSDVFPHDFVVLKRGDKFIKCRPPKFYSTQFELSNFDDYQKLKARREVRGSKHLEDQTHERLMVREEVQFERLSQLKRGFEKNGS